MKLCHAYDNWSKSSKVNEKSLQKFLIQCTSVPKLPLHVE